jgi:hypothetical protein
MPIVRVEGLSVEEAEKVVALVWQVLEANNIDTPHMATVDRGGVCLAFSFASSEAADLVIQELRRAARVPSTMAAE